MKKISKNTKQIDCIDNIRTGQNTHAESEFIIGDSRLDIKKHQTKQLNFLMRLFWLEQRLIP